MPEKIQRIPQGLNQLLSLAGGRTPIELEDRVRSSLELLQFYGMQQQRVVIGSNPTLAELGVVDAVSFSPTGNNGALGQMWAVLFGASMGVIKTATMTAASITLELQRRGSGNSITLATMELQQFGATVTGSQGCNFIAPYPMILPPPWSIFGRLTILGTDATASCSCIAEVGIFG